MLPDLGACNTSKVPSWSEPTKGYVKDKSGAREAPRALDLRRVTIEAHRQASEARERQARERDAHTVGDEVPPATGPNIDGRRSSHGLCGWRGRGARSTILFVSDAAKKILAQIEELPEEEQDLIVDTLVARRRGTDGVSPKMRDDLLRRVRRIKSGEVGLLDGEEAFRKLRAKYDR